MNNKQKYLILKTVQENNILPVTSKCNLKCKFCSHYQNPPELDVESYGHLSLNFIEKMIDFLPKEGAVLLGESATKIIEGEPFSHPQIKEILKILRKKCPEKEIKITTNGSFLSDSIIALINELGNISLNISLNCSSPAERDYLMNDLEGEKVFRAIKSLNNRQIKYNGSIVALPHIMGWDSLKKTIKFLDKQKAETIRVFMPAFTDYSDESMKFKFALYSKLNNFVNKINQRVKTPVIFEPPFLKNLDAVIKGVISGTAAADTNLEKGDIIANVNGKKVLSRVDAFTKIKKSENPILNLSDNSKSDIVLNKDKGQRSGLVMDYDLDPVIIDKLIKIIKNCEKSNIILITSKMAKEMLEFLNNNQLKEIFPEKKIKVLEVKNKFFGGSIVTAGLLTVNDIRSELEKYKLKRLENSLIILPSIMFDDYEKDLRGQDFNKILKRFGVEIKIL